MWPVLAPGDQDSQAASRRQGQGRESAIEKPGPLVPLKCAKGVHNSCAVEIGSILVCKIDHDQTRWICLAPLSPKIRHHLISSTFTIYLFNGFQWAVLLKFIKFHQPTSWGRTSTVEITRKRGRNRKAPKSSLCNSKLRPRWRSANSCQMQGQEANGHFFPIDGGSINRGTQK